MRWNLHLCQPKMLVWNLHKDWGLRGGGGGWLYRWRGLTDWGICHVLFFVMLLLISPLDGRFPTAWLIPCCGSLFSTVVSSWPGCWTRSASEYLEFWHYCCHFLLWYLLWNWSFSAWRNFGGLLMQSYFWIYVSFYETWFHALRLFFFHFLCIIWHKYARSFLA